MTLKKYHQKRTFSKTPEPSGKGGTVRSHLRATTWRQKQKKAKQLVFVVQEHHASHVHWDFRLEMEGVLKSWAIPKGPSMDPEIKHLAVHVEDHPYDYRKFHGRIPKGNYGAGTVEIWDEGTYEPAEPTDDPEKVLLAGLKKGDLKFIMYGKKLKGEFALVKMHTTEDEEKNWLLIKKRETSLRGVNGDDVKKTPMPHEITPMLAKLAEKPFSEEGWIYELKWDGYRAVAEITKGKVKLYSRNQKDFTNDYPDVVDALKGITHDAVLDGEITAVDATGTAKFQYLQSYIKNPQGITLIYEVFDLLYLDGYDLRGYPLIERKKLLKKLLPPRVHISYSDHVAKEGDKLFKLAKKKQLEGIMAKKKDSQYVSIRSTNWLKIKNIQTQEALICGYTQPRGSREEFGALVLGIYDNGELRYVGHTGSGFDREKLQDIIKQLKPLEQTVSSFPHAPKTNMPATWVKPKLIAQIKFGEWTKDGLMRQPIFLGLRTDKSPKEVTQEQRVTSLRAPAKQSQTKEIAASSSTQPQGHFLWGARNDGRVVLSNQDKIFWPQEGYTKGDVIQYYDKVSPFILPYLKDRAQSLNRHPNGIEGESFYQKDLTNKPDWVRTERLYSSHEQKYIHWLICNDKETLLYMANLGCIEINPWNSRISKKDNPDYLIIDLDPNGADFIDAVQTALEVKKIMDKADIACFVKTSGKTGLHILVPLGAKYTFDQTRQFAEILANLVHEALPQTTSVVRDPSKRHKKVYIDFLQNRVGQTIAAPYSIRPVPGAQVSTPLTWEEVTPKLSPHEYTIKTIFKRLEKHGDIWKGFLTHKGIDMKKSLKLLTK